MAINKKLELAWLKQELSTGDLWNELNIKTPKCGGSKEVYVFENYVIKLLKEDMDIDQLLYELYVWKNVPKYIKKYLAPIRGYGVNILENQFFKDLGIRKTKKYKNFEHNFIIMDKIDTSFKCIKENIFDKSNQIKSIKDIDELLELIANCSHENIKYKNIGKEKIEPFRKEMSKFIMDENYPDNLKYWIDDLIFANIGYNVEKGILQVIDYGLC